MESCRIFAGGSVTNIYDKSRLFRSVSRYWFITARYRYRSCVFDFHITRSPRIRYFVWHIDATILKLCKNLHASGSSIREYIRGSARSVNPFYTELKARVVHSDKRVIKNTIFSRYRLIAASLVSTNWREMSSTMHFNARFCLDKID